MGLARSWRLRLYASLSLAVVVPAALLVSLALLATGGGAFTLASLKQAISGPSTPVVQPVGLGVGLGRPVSGASHARAGAALLAAAPVSAGGSRVSPSGGGSGVGGSGRSVGSVGGGALPGRGGSGGLGSGSGSGGGVGSGSGSGGGGGSGSGSGSGAGQGGSGSGGGGSHPPGHHTVVDRIVSALTPVSSSLPAPVGPVLTGVLKSGGSTADKVLGGLP